MEFLIRSISGEKVVEGSYKRICLFRDAERQGTFIEIKTLDELLKLSRQYGDLIFNACGDNPLIEIYDGYRE